MNHSHELTATQRGIKAMLPALVIDLVTPLAVYGALQLAGLPVIGSLAGAAAVPAIRILATAVRKRRVNGLALLVLTTLAVGVTLTLLTGSPRLAIARDAVIGFTAGIAFLGSLAMRRPATFYLLRSFRGQALQDQWDRLPRLRRDLRSMTAAIGGLCILDAALRVLIAYTLPLRTAGTLVHLQPIALICLLMLIGKWWGDRIRRYIPADR